MCRNTKCNNLLQKPASHTSTTQQTKLAARFRCDIMAGNKRPKVRRWLTDDDEREVLLYKTKVKSKAHRRWTQRAKMLQNLFCSSTPRARSWSPDRCLTSKPKRSEPFHGPFFRRLRISLSSFFLGLLRVLFGVLFFGFFVFTRVGSFWSCFFLEIGSRARPLAKSFLFFVS